MVTKTHLVYIQSDTSSLVNTDMLHRHICIWRTAKLLVSGLLILKKSHQYFSFEKHVLKPELKKLYQYYHGWKICVETYALYLFLKIRNLIMRINRDALWWTHINNNKYTVPYAFVRKANISTNLKSIYLSSSDFSTDWVDLRFLLILNNKII